MAEPLPNARSVREAYRRRIERERAEKLPPHLPNAGFDLTQPIDSEKSR